MSGTGRRRWPVWSYYALAGGIIAVLLVLDRLGAGTPFAPG